MQWSAQIGDSARAGSEEERKEETGSVTSRVRGRGAHEFSVYGVERHFFAGDSVLTISGYRRRHVFVSFAKREHAGMEVK